jgi:hypothetical protein
MLDVVFAVVLFSSGSALADVHYVDVNSTNATPPYTNWTTAATAIQDAVDAAVAGDEIVVTNGIYATGGRATVGDSTPNRVAVDKALSVRSVNGPQFTTINGGGSGRCVYLTNSATLSGFMLTNGLTYDVGGAGVWCQSTYAVVSNCVIIGNGASASSSFGYASGGGAYGGTLNNCIVYFNTNNSPFGGANYDGSPMNYCCTTPDPGGSGNITNAPLFVDQASGDLRLQPNSPCINAGNNSYVTNLTDLDGHPRISGGTVDMGAYELQFPQLRITVSGSMRVLTWSTEAGRRYQLQYRHDWTSVNWINLSGPIIASGATLSFIDSYLFDPWRLYRAVVLP